MTAQGDSLFRAAMAFAATSHALLALPGARSRKGSARAAARAGTSSSSKAASLAARSSLAGQAVAAKQLTAQRPAARALKVRVRRGAWWRQGAI